MQTMRVQHSFYINKNFPEFSQKHYLVPPNESTAQPWWGSTTGFKLKVYSGLLLKNLWRTLAVQGSKLSILSGQPDFPMNVQIQRIACILFSTLSAKQKLQRILTMFPGGQGVSMPLGLIKSQTPPVCRNNSTLCHKIQHLKSKHLKYVTPSLHGAVEHSTPVIFSAELV